MHTPIQREVYREARTSVRIIEDSTHSLDRGSIDPARYIHSIEQLAFEILDPVGSPVVLSPRPRCSFIRHSRFVPTFVPLFRSFLCTIRRASRHSDSGVVPVRFGFGGGAA